MNACLAHHEFYLITIPMLIENGLLFFRAKC